MHGLQNLTCKNKMHHMKIRCQWGREAFIFCITYINQGRRWRMEMESSTKMFWPIYKIMWCHTVNSSETHIERVLVSLKVVPENILPLHPKREKTKFMKFCAEWDRNHLQCVKLNLQSNLFFISMSHNLKTATSYNLVDLLNFACKIAHQYHWCTFW